MLRRKFCSRSHERSSRQIRHSGACPSSQLKRGIYRKQPKLPLKLTEPSAEVEMKITLWNAPDAPSSPRKMYLMSLRSRLRLFLRRFFLAKQRRKTSMDGTSTPVSTACISDHEQWSEPNVVMTRSEDEVSLIVTWKYADDDRMSYSDDSPVQVTMTLRERVRRSLRRIVRGGGQCEAKSLLKYEQTSSSHFWIPKQGRSSFSVSTEHKVFQSTESDAKDDEHEDDDKDDYSISLKECIEVEHESSYLDAIQLCNISVQDNISADSTYLAVSFDDDYPQLVIQSSSHDSAFLKRCDNFEDPADRKDQNDGSPDEDETNQDAPETPRRGRALASFLGVSFPHPARRGFSPDAFSSETRDTSSYSMQWLDEKVTQEVWGRIDGARGEDDDAILVPVDYSPMTSKPAPMNVKTRAANWSQDEDEDDDETMRWSFSLDGSDISFSSIVGGKCAKSTTAPIELFPDTSAITADDRPFDEYD